MRFVVLATHRDFKRFFKFVLALLEFRLLLGIERL
jgi:hypothetical protein